MICECMNLIKILLRIEDIPETNNEDYYRCQNEALLKLKLSIKDDLVLEVCNEKLIADFWTTLHDKY